MRTARRCVCLIGTSLTIAFTSSAVQAQGVVSDASAHLGKIRLQLAKISEQTIEFDRLVTFESDNAVQLEQRLNRGDTAIARELRDAMARTRGLWSEIGKTAYLLTDTQRVLRDLQSTPARLRSPSFDAELRALTTMADGLRARLTHVEFNLIQVRNLLRDLMTRIG